MKTWNCTICLLASEDLGMTNIFDDCLNGSSPFDCGCTCDLICFSWYFLIASFYLICTEYASLSALHQLCVMILCTICESAHTAKFCLVPIWSILSQNYSVWSTWNDSTLNLQTIFLFLFLLHSLYSLWMRSPGLHKAQANDTLNDINHVCSMSYSI